MKDIKISKEQAQEFATAIYADIAEYIKNHQAEYITASISSENYKISPPAVRLPEIEEEQEVIF